MIIRVFGHGVNVEYTEFGRSGSVCKLGKSRRYCLISLLSSAFTRSASAGSLATHAYPSRSFSIGRAGVPQ